jgi:hypothetical protein
VTISLVELEKTDRFRPFMGGEGSECVLDRATQAPAARKSGRNRPKTARNRDKAVRNRDKTVLDRRKNAQNPSKMDRNRVDRDDSAANR